LMNFLLRIFPLAIENLKSKIYKTAISSVVYGCKIWSPPLRGKCRLKMSDDMEVRRIFMSTRQVVKRCIMMSLMICPDITMVIK
jgi:hypothetical protein